MALHEGPTALQSPFWRAGSCHWLCHRPQQSHCTFHVHLCHRRQPGQLPCIWSLVLLPSTPGTTGIAFPGISQSHVGRSRSSCGQWAQHQGHNSARVCQHLPGHSLQWEAFPWGGIQGKLLECPAWIRSGPALGLLSQPQGCPLVTAHSESSGAEPSAWCHLSASGSRVGAAWVGFVWCSSVLYF